MNEIECNKIYVGLYTRLLYILVTLNQVFRKYVRCYHFVIGLVWYVATTPGTCIANQIIHRYFVDKLLGFACFDL